MKNRYIGIILSIFFVGSVLPSIYLWESVRDGERSCCLFIGGADICNPYVPCKRHAYSDLMGIYDYISRILQVDKGSTFSYHKTLGHAQSFIRYHLSSSALRIYYRFEENRSVKFYHEIQELAKITEKSSKGSSTTPLSVAGDKQKAEDVVLAYLAKMNLARPISSK